MMAQTIDPHLQLPPHQDFAALRDEAVGFLTALDGQPWTDFNPSEPGLTLLETALSGFTDLGYRLDHDIADLLAPAAADEAWQALPDAAAALSCEPVSQNDLALALADQPALSAVCLAAAPEPGAIDVWLTPRRALDDQEKLAARQTAWRRFHRQRPLGLRPGQIMVRDKASLYLFPELELSAAAPAEETLAALIRLWRQALQAPPVYQSAAACLAAGQSGDTVYDGPLLEQGVRLAGPASDGQALASRLIDLALGLPGVTRVDSLQFSAAPAKETLSDRAAGVWSWTAPDDSYLLLESEELIDWWSGAAILQGQNFDPLHRNSQRLRVDAARLRALLADQAATDAAAPALPPTFGRYRRLSDFPAFSPALPAQFGLSGPSPAASAQEKAGLLQLQAYLLPLEQLQANQAAQLENIRQLLELPRGDWLATLSALLAKMQASESLSRADIDAFWRAAAALPPSTLRQPVSPLPLAEGLFAADDLAAYRVAGAETALETPLSERWLDRTLRRLQHLLARFGENLPDAAQLRYRGVFSHYAAQLLTSGSALPIPADALPSRLAALKQALDLASFLLDFPRLSAARGSGADIAASLHSRSGLELRLARRLGIPLEHSPLSLGNREGLYLVEGALLLQQDGSPPSAERARRLYWILPRYGCRFGNDAFRALVEQAICEETPLHLQPMVCWLDGKGLNQMERLYHHWRAKWLELGGPAAPTVPGEADWRADGAPHSRRARLWDCSRQLASALDDCAVAPDFNPERWLSHIGSDEISGSFTVGYADIPALRPVSPRGKIGDPGQPFAIAISAPLPLND
ncbi:hypothetical protein BUE93_21800 [Chromobacterium amazonense]|uniref:Uncharacterized protein n=1 Tax=Chromobacterium amazonense TaxID=1382803 RepID=A0A2S9WYI3_9NEIS|nr:hypothetical protein [Chromobacterium amazonense]PRP68527.1 hypothetical protein BUE93_21800 [Chromobacterium amazonense]